MKRCLPALLFVIAFSAPAFAKSYLNGIDADYPPFSYLDEKSGQAAGFDVEALDWIAKAMGFEVVHTPLAWDAAIPALLAKRIDMVCSGMSITPERESQAAFSAPYWKLYSVFVVKKGSDLSVPAILCERLRVGGQRGASEAEALAREQKEKKLRFDMRLYDSVPQMIEDVISGRIEAALMDTLPARDAVKRGKPVRIAGIHGKAVQYAVAFRKEDEELRKLVNEGYKKLMADPFWQRLQQKYGMQAEK
jgi:polar amino acid transport system substrate-binding protein